MRELVDAVGGELSPPTALYRRHLDVLTGCVRGTGSIDDPGQLDGLLPVLVDLVRYGYLHVVKVQPDDVVHLEITPEGQDVTTRTCFECGRIHDAPERVETCSEE